MPIEPHHLDNLLLLEQFLRREVPPERFNYDYWVCYDWGGMQDLSCGTSACALGWAVQIPEFRLEYFRYAPWAHAEIRSKDDESIKTYISFSHETRRAIVHLFGYGSMHLFYRSEEEPIHDPSFVADKILAYIEANA